MITSLVSMYEKGAITADHLAAQCIHMIDPEDAGLVLSDLPNSILDRILAYASRYRPGLMLSTYGPLPLPAADQVEAAKTWIEDYQTVKEGGRTTSEADWKRYKMEERIEEILRSFADLSNRYSLTIYQIAIEFAQRYETDFLEMGRPLGGAGAGNRALTIYMSSQLSKRIKAGRADRIEMQFLHPVDTERLIYKYKNQHIIATTPAAGFPVPMYRLRQPT
jgi:hypothetical protein